MYVCLSKVFGYSFQFYTNSERRRQAFLFFVHNGFYIFGKLPKNHWNRAVDKPIKGRATQFEAKKASQQKLSIMKGRRRVGSYMSRKSSPGIPKRTRFRSSINPRRPDYCFPPFRSRDRHYRGKSYACASPKYQKTFYSEENHRGRSLWSDRPRFTTMDWCM